MTPVIVESPVPLLITRRIGLYKPDVLGFTAISSCMADYNVAVIRGDLYTRPSVIYIPVKRSIPLFIASRIGFNQPDISSIDTIGRGITYDNITSVGSLLNRFSRIVIGAAKCLINNDIIICQESDRTLRYPGRIPPYL